MNRGRGRRNGLTSAPARVAAGDYQQEDGANEATSHELLKIAEAGVARPNRTDVDPDADPAW